MIHVTAPEPICSEHVSQGALMAILRTLTCIIATEIIATEIIAIEEKIPHEFLGKHDQTRI